MGANPTGEHLGTLVSSARSRGAPASSARIALSAAARAIPLLGLLSGGAAGAEGETEPASPPVVFFATDSQQWCEYTGGGPLPVLLIPISDTQTQVPVEEAPGTPAEERTGASQAEVPEAGGTAATSSSGAPGTTTPRTDGSETATGAPTTATVAGSVGHMPGTIPKTRGPHYCGPDVTRAYLAALHRVYRRMSKLPDSEKGPKDGSYFLKRNGWNVDQWPDPEITHLGGGVSCPSGWCAGSGNEKGQSCYTLFGICVPRHVLNDIMLGFTADLVGVPSSMQNIAGHYAESRFNVPGTEHKGHDWKSELRAILLFADPRISQRSYELGDELAEEWAPEFEDWFTDAPDPKKLNEWINDNWVDFKAELAKAYPWVASCQPCPGEATVSGWFRDWSRHPWRLADGSEVPYAE
jgi:hypothetical protein